MRIFRKSAKLALIAAVGLLAFHACSSSVMEPEADNSVAATAWELQTFQDETPAILGDINIRDAYSEPLLQKVTGRDYYAKPTDRLTNLLNFAESLEEDLDFTGRKWTIVSQVISAADGGIIEFGNDRVGMSTIEFAPGALSEDTRITIVHKLRGKRDIFFFPEGIEFGAEVTVNFNLIGLSNRQLEKLLNLRLYYHNVELGGWELVDSESNGEWVTAWLDHFSRYAVGSDN